MDLSKENITFSKHDGSFNTEEFLNKLCNINQRDILSATLRKKKVSFSTTINFKSLDGFKKVIKNEVFEFETKGDASLFFYKITSDLNKQG